MFLLCFKNCQNELILEYQINIIKHCKENNSGEELESSADTVSND